MIDDPAKAIRRAVLVAKGLSRAIGPMPGKDEGERVHPASLIPGVHVQAIEPQNFAGGGEVGDNPNFKKWFGNSVLHDDGTPRKYYTGTSKDKDFSAFNVGRHGAWFTTDPHEASMYATTNDSQGHVYEGGQYKSTNTASRVIPAYLKAENPYTGGLPVGVQSQNYKKSQSDWFDKLRAAGHDAWVPEELGGRLAVMLRHPTQIKSAVTNTGDYDPSKPRIDRAFGGEVQPTDETGFDAFHGTPHKFEPEPGAPLGRFRSDKIGTGEGAQAFGHGLYVGEEGTAGGYRKSVGRKRLIEIAQDSYDEHDNPQAAEKALFSHPELSPSDKNLLTELKKEDYLGFDYPHQAISAVMGKNAGNYDISPALENAMNTHGHIYHVRVNANPEHFLDWDKPLSEQTEYVRNKLESLNISTKNRGEWTVKPTSSNKWTVYNVWGEPSGTFASENDARAKAAEKTSEHNAFGGMYAYGKLGGNTAYSALDKGAASAALHAAGIPGIRYLDANSRGPTGNPTHNHVIFDPSIIDIKRRYKRGGGVHGYKTDGFVPSGGEASGYKDVPFQHIEKRSPGWGATWTPLETVSEKIGNLNKISKNAANYGDFMNSMAHKASTQGLSPRDLIKAYLMTISSQGRAAVTPHTILKNWPEYPGPTHEKIRPEGAMGEWLSSPIGKRYLDNAEQGKIDQGAIDHALNAFKGFGKVNDAEGTALPWAVHSLAPHTKIVSDMIAASLKGKHPAEDWRNWVKENVNGVGFAKAGFWGSMLGRGDQGVPDARQLVLNTPNKSQEATNLIGVGESRPANLREKEAMQRLMDRQRALSFAIPKELAPHYHALAHHTIWDAAEGTDTTHQDVINAMQHAATGGTIHPAHEHPLARAMREIGMPGLDGHYDNIDHALSVVRSHKPHRR